MDYNSERKKNPNPIENANFLSIITMFYALPTFRKGYKNDLEISDLYNTLEEHKSDRLGNEIELAWEKELILARKAKRKPHLRRVFFRTYGCEIFKYGLLVAFSELVIKIFQSLTLGQLLIYYRPNQVEVSEEQAYLYSSIIVLCSLGNLFIVNKYTRGLIDLGMKVRVAFCSLIYRKALKLNKSTLAYTTIGQMVNLLSNDVNRFDTVNLFGIYILISPFQTLLITYLMYQSVGIAAIIGICSLIIFVPLQMFLGKKLATFRSRTAIRTDERIRLMNEIVTGIQVIKMYTWEKPFAKLVAFTRRFEINSIKKSSYALGVISSLNMFMTRLSLYVTVLAYALLTNRVVASTAFELTAFYNILRQSITIFFAQGLGRIAEATVSLNRLTEFMLFEESTSNQNASHPKIIINGNGDIKKILSYDDELAVNLKHATVKWSENSKENTLVDINLQVRFGNLISVVGPVGSGKSSLLYTILKELPLTKGTLLVNGTISYASQEPWIFPGTVRQNILFGLPFNKFRYRNVIKKCALVRDFSLFPGGDKTIVGERGITISGGQKARINLARAVYRDADLYLLDDPLSAVDTRVGKQLFDECICGLLKGKTVILITHQLQYLKNIERIIILQNGLIKAEGNLEELKKSGLDFAQLLKSENKENIDADIDEFMYKQLLSCGRDSLASTLSTDGGSLELVVEESEHRSKGSMTGAIYKSYFTAGSHVFVVITVFMLFIIAQIAASGADYFLSHWVNYDQALYEQFKGNVSEDTSIKEKNFKDLFHISINSSIKTYSIIIFITICVSLIRSFAYYAMCMRSSIKLHDKMFGSVIRATTQFFNVNQSGRILNRFSKDMGAIDELLPLTMMDFLQVAFTFLGIIVVIAIANPWLLIPTLVVAICFYFVRKGYLLTSKSVKRLEGITRSPVFAYLSSSIQGLTTIRAFGVQTILKKEFDGHQDLHSSAWFLYLVTTRALGFSLDLLCIAYLAIVTFIFLLIGTDRYPGNVGLAVSQAVGLTGMLPWGIKQSTETENQMTSVERALEYTRIDSESSLESSPEKQPPRSWPEKGKVQFKNVYLRYFRDNPPVLKNLNFTIQSNEKVGIVGRTGAGKSSLIAALFRLVETDGSIIIDDIPIKQLGLHDLRSKISIIPQEPVLFSGTLRRNLDPFDEYTDEILWNALEEVELKRVVSDLCKGLSSLVSEGGSNFSVGQRQLVCLARALVRKNKILMLDEATANVDPQTDALIQMTIRKKFVNCTVLTIAHRLHTVMDSDKVLVIDGGNLLEFDHPYVLLQKSNGYFYGMVQQTGETMAKTLTNISHQSYYLSHPVEDLIKL